MTTQDTDRETRKTPKGVQRTEELVAALRRWQGIERQSVDQTTTLMERTTNPLIRQVMEIIRNDSIQHHRVQQFLIDSLTTSPVTLRPEDLAEIWDAVQAHIAAEAEAIELAETLRKGCPSFVQRELLDYLLADEKKHDVLLGQLEAFKKNLYPYA
jgi:rubrerythrin